MVKLGFNSTTSKDIASKSSKSILPEEKLNPFKSKYSEEYINLIETNKSPKTNLIGLDSFLFVLSNWYSESLTNTQSQFLLVIGPVGCGKSTLLSQFCENNGILSLNINETSKNKKDIFKEILIFSSNSFFQSGLKKLIIIDHYSVDTISINDIILLYQCRCCKLTKIELSELNKSFEIDVNNLKTLVLPPIVIVSSDSKGSRLSDLKKTTNVYYINEIGKGLITNFISNTVPLNENITNLIDKCGSDIRLLLNNLNLNVDNTDFYKDSDLNLFEFVNRLFDNIEIIPQDEIFKAYSTDGYILTNLVYENYLDYSDSIESIADSAEAMSIAETMYSDMYDSLKTFIPEVHCSFGLLMPSVYSRSDIKKNKVPLRSSIINNRHNVYLNNIKILSKINESTHRRLDITEVLFFKTFITSELVKNKNISSTQIEYLKNMLNLFDTDSRIDILELIFKHFNTSQNSERRTKNFTIKFKEKLIN